MTFEDVFYDNVVTFNDGSFVTAKETGKQQFVEWVNADYDCEYTTDDVCEDFVRWCFQDNPHPDGNSLGWWLGASGKGAKEVYVL